MLRLTIHNFSPRGYASRGRRQLPISVFTALFGGITAGLFLPVTVHAQVIFTPLGGVPGENNFLSDALGVSADGSVIVGRINSSTSSMSFEGDEASRWTSGEGMVGLGFLPGGSFSESLGVSADGSVVIGRSSFGNTPGSSQAFRWTQENGMAGLGFLPGGNANSIAYGVSGDGNVVIGYSASANGFSEAFRWTPDSGMIGLGDLPGGNFRSVANAVSTDGNVIVGYGTSFSSTTSSGQQEAFRWTQDTGLVGIGFLPGGGSSLAYGTSANGSVVVGYSTSSTGTYEAFRWTEDAGMVGLGYLTNPGDYSAAYGVSGDGNVVVGYGNYPNGTEAFLWTHGMGMVHLESYLLANFASSLPANFSQWTLTYARGISTDGTTIIGYGVNPNGRREAWRIYSPNGFGTSASAAAPEPGTLVLFGIGLSVLSIARRRKKAATCSDSSHLR